jgi:hypothetical protein
MTGEPGGLDDAVEDEIEFRRTGQSQVEAGDLALQLGREGFPNAEEDEELAGAAGIAQGVAQLAMEDGIFVLEERAEIPQEDDGIVLEVGDLIKGHGRIRTGLDRAKVVSTNPSVALQAWRGRWSSSAAALTMASARASSAVQRKRPA